MPRFLFKSAAATKIFAAKLAKKIISNKSNFQLRTATIVALVGDLGAGKTTFTQGFARGLGIKRRAISPTFLIFRVYRIPHLKSSRVLRLASYIQRFYHVDAYRLHSPKEILALGFKKILSNPENIVLIEWAEKIKKILPKDTIWLKFENGKKQNERLLTF